MRYRIIIGFLFLALPFSTGAYSVPEMEYWRAYELSLINASREEHSLPPVGLDDEISEMSQAHATDTAVHFDTISAESRRKTYLGHDSSDGKSFPGRVNLKEWMRRSFKGYFEDIRVFRVTRSYFYYYKKIIWSGNSK